MYYDRRWREQSVAFLRRFPFCVLCLARGQTNQGANENQTQRQRSLVVDHITPHRGDRELFWDQDNWQTLCRTPCHDRDKRLCEMQRKDWWDIVRAEIEQHKSREYVMSYAQWLPRVVANSIYVV